MNPIECHNVWKKYTKGEKVYALRDAIPQMFQNVFSKNHDKDVLADKEFWALKDVSFELKRGEVLGIIGPNGAGKSTILKLLSRIIKPTKGSFQVNGRLSALIEITAGFHPDFTGRENVYFNGAILGMTKKEIESKFDQIVDFSGVEEFIDTPVKRYSSGMYARLGFSVAAHVNPEILLVDEVLAVGDMNFQAKCAQKMRELLKSGTTIVLVAHNIPLVQSICTRILLMNHGEVIKEGSAEEVIPHYQNLIFRKTEDELKKKVSSHKVDIASTKETHVEILKVSINGRDFNQNDVVKSEEAISIHIDYTAHNKIQDPIFTLSIVRADGVVCCSTNTLDANHSIAQIHGPGQVQIHFGHLHLTPGVYHLSMSICDKELIHAYAVRNKDVFKIEADQLFLDKNAVFIPPVRWESGTKSTSFQKIG